MCNRPVGLHVDRFEPVGKLLFEVYLLLLVFWDGKSEVFSAVRVSVSASRSGGASGKRSAVSVVAAVGKLEDVRSTRETDPRKQNQGT